MKLYNVFLILLIASVTSNAQTAERWQQHAQYKMEITVDAPKHQFQGKQWLVYTNNSPDALESIYYHLFFNAFQPESMMDVRSRTIADPDKRVGDRISQLTDDEIGYQNVTKLTAGGKDTEYKMEGTILEVNLPEAVLPGASVLLYMEFDGQVPLQVRRSGRDNAEGIEFSMTQWYPKLCEYDYQGWHANPYVGREFHGVWGDFDVKISIDPDYMIGATGVLQNRDEIFDGDLLRKSKKKYTTWNFRADNVHDFAWAADPDYKQLSHTAHDGTQLYALYQDGPLASQNFPELLPIIDEALRYINDRYGKYPYPVYSFLQGGDGGMEYPMATLITGERPMNSLVGVSIHELFHSWYQMILGTNESLYPWMDEGFTSFSSSEIMNYLKSKSLIEGEIQDNPHYNVTRSFAGFTASGLEEPLSTHSDHYTTNTAYGVGSYTKGSVFLKQLEYIIGKESFDQGLMNYFETWKFKHPNPNDFIRVIEKTAGMELDWYLQYWVNSTATIDYEVADLQSTKRGTNVMLKKVGRMPMPIDLTIKRTDGKVTMFTIPLRIMRSEKSKEQDINLLVLPDWPWTHADYSFELPYPKDEIESVEIDPSYRMADIDLDNNVWPRVEKELEEELEEEVEKK
jgi:hypothetical protein